MSGGGAIAAMVQSIKSNRNLLKEKSHAFKNRIGNDSPYKHNKLSFKKATSEELQEFRQKLLKQKKFEQKIRITIYLILLLILSLALYYISI